MLVTLSYIAIAVLAFSYWLQIWKIHVHKEVRDLSISYHVLLAIGFGVLIITAVYEQSTIFLVKQIATFVPVLVLIWQIVYHGYLRHDHWHDEKDMFCKGCRSELEIEWAFCPYCSREKFKVE